MHMKTITDSNFHFHHIKNVWISGLASLVMTCFLFLLLPLTQLISTSSIKREEKREITIHPTPPPPKMQKTAPKIKTQKEALLQRPPSTQQHSRMSVQTLNINVAPGIGDSLTLSDPLNNFDIEMDVSKVMKEIFTFADLNTAPRYLSVPPFQFPKELVRQGIRQGRVVLEIEINTKGRARVMRIVSSTHPRLTIEAKRIVTRSRFTIPMVNGQAQKVIGHWPIVLKASR